jgi:CubicO group peptidase (beta-lactamase class C family)
MRSGGNLEKKFEQKLKEQVGDPLLYAPTQKLCVFHRGKVAFRWETGEDFLYFDLASLTKILFSASLWMRLFQEHSFHLSEKAVEFLPWWPGGAEVSLKGLLTHSAGLTWWKPYFEQIGKGFSHEHGWRKLRDLLSVERPQGEAPHAAVYSDLDLFYLGFMAEEITGKNLFDLWLEVKDQMGFSDLHFRKTAPSVKESSLYAPTGFSEWRGRVLQGEVHDDNAAALGGIAPHAGLFGGLGDLESYLRHLRKLWQEAPDRGVKPEVFKEFTRRQTPPARGDFGYLFWKPTKGASSSGKYFGDSSFGHTGFTGTSIWCDPKKDLAVIFLTNRVAYEAELDQFRPYRPLVHDLVGEVIL